MNVFYARHRFASVVAFAIHALAFAACGSDPPTAPTRSDPPGLIRDAAKLVRLDIDGPETVAPRETVQFKAVGHFEDGSSRDLTTAVVWQGAGRILTGSVVGGRFTGNERGEETILAEVHVPVFVRATRRILVMPPGTFRLTGRVVEAESPPGPVLGADVEIVGDDELSTLTDAGGSFRLYGVSGPVTLRVAKDGYVTDERRLDIGSDQSIDISLGLRRPRPEMGGTFTLTVIADQDCRPSANGATVASGSIPDALRVRTYAADLVQTANQLKLRVFGPTLVPSPGFDNTFSGRLEPGRLIVGFGSYSEYSRWEFGVPGIVETLSPSSFVVVDGDAVLATDTLSGTLRGAVMSFSRSPWQYLSVPDAGCWSDQHHIQLTR